MALTFVAQAGITYSEFFDMTWGEVVPIVQVYMKKQEDEIKSKLALNYSLADMISYFTCLRLNGNKIPSLQESYPELIKDKKQKQDMSWMVWKEQFIDYANAHNMRLEGEN